MIDLDENKTPEAIIAEAMVSAGAPLMHSRVEKAVAGALRKAGMLAEQSGQVCAWCPSPARGSAHHNDGKLHPSCGQTNHGQGWVPDYPVERIGAIEAERDAALPAIERVRVLHRRLNIVDEVTDERLGDACEVCGEIEGYELTWPCLTVAALDGAPEPESRWEYRGRLQSCGYVAEGYISAEHAMNGLRVELEDHPYLAMDDTAIVERARVREWLPVEGESKP